MLYLLNKVLYIKQNDYDFLPKNPTLVFGQPNYYKKMSNNVKYVNHGCTDIYVRYFISCLIYQDLLSNLLLIVFYHDIYEKII